MTEAATVFWFPIEMLKPIPGATIWNGKDRKFESVARPLRSNRTTDLSSGNSPSTTTQAVARNRGWRRKSGRCRRREPSSAKGLFSSRARADALVPRIRGSNPAAWRYDMRTLRDAASYHMALPGKTRQSDEWQVAIEALLKAAENRGPLMHARIGMLRALNRHVERVFDSSREAERWDAESGPVIDDRLASRSRSVGSSRKITEYPRFNNSLIQIVKASSSQA
jgi:hypothetical protein